jgi:hypothetical protein
MNVFKIPESLEIKYHGSGYGLIATLNGEVVDLKYFEDISDDFYIDADEAVVADRIKTIIEDKRLSETVRYFQSLGEVHVGIFSCYEFCEL